MSMRYSTISVPVVERGKYVNLFEWKVPKSELQPNVHVQRSISLHYSTLPNEKLWVRAEVTES